ncbi:hypothetical protein [Streptomyces atroolivaceus]
MSRVPAGLIRHLELPAQVPFIGVLVSIASLPLVPPTRCGGRRRNSAA